MQLKNIIVAIVCFLMLLEPAYGSENSTIQKHANWLVEMTDIDHKFAYDVTRYIYANCDHPVLILSIAVPESNMDPKAKRRGTRVYGLGQIKFDVWKKELYQFKIYRPADLQDWRKNILAMDYITKKYYEESNGNISKVIKKYTGGGCKSHQNKIKKNMYALNKISKGGKTKVS